MHRILLALDLSPASRRAADYAIDVVSSLPDCEIILLSVLSGVPYGGDDLQAAGSLPPEVHGYEDHRREINQIEDFLLEIRDILIDSGLPGERIKTIIRPLSLGVAMDILDEAVERECRTIVIGRRGRSKILELLQGSVSDELVHKAESRAIWVVE